MEAFFVVLMAATMLGVGVAALLATRRLSSLADEVPEPQRGVTKKVDAADEDTVVIRERGDA